MDTRRLPFDERSCWRGIVLIVLVCLLAGAPAAVVSAAAPVAPASDDGDARTPLLATAATNTVCLVAFWNSVLGNQTRMIQVGLVIIAIGIFILTRSIK